MPIEDDLKKLQQGVNDIRKATVDDADPPLRKAISLAADLVGIASVIGVPAAVAQLVGLFSGNSDPIASALNKIESLLEVTFSFEQSEAELTQMQNVNSLASTSYSRLHSLLEERLPYSASALDSTNTVTLSNVDALEQEPQWKRVFFDELVYQDVWFGKVLPPSDQITTSKPGRSFVFDYRLTLPCYLSAIRTRLSAIVILFSNNFLIKNDVMQEIRDRANSLESFYQRILRGFTPSKTPSFFPDIQYVSAALPNSPPVLVSPFDGSSTNRPVGVINAYEGSGIVDTYPKDAYPNPAVGPFFGNLSPPPSEYFEFAARYQLGIIKRKIQIYTDIGLDKAWESLQDLRRASEQIPEAFDQHQYWSLQDVNGALGAADLINTGGQGVPPSPLSLFETVRRLAMIGKVDNSQQLFISYREALEAASV